ncbi:beta-N-acetylhexosaminidase [Flexithrix dorotheae]|uniref:beta-N-acetylhexosaminidase n=1 Tax=Flexithrix dorotheae TaxID=70993 RepID=UPI000382320A|nr:beta-N-acetylhexosaminidase [Flexithrix dorotheae]
MKSFKIISSFFAFSLSLVFLLTFKAKATDLYQLGLNVIPYPQEVIVDGDNFYFESPISIVLDPNASEDDKFTADVLITELKEEFGITAKIASNPSGNSIILTKKGISRKVGVEGYHLFVDHKLLTIKAESSTGLFYGAQTLLQLIKKGKSVPFIYGMQITDWPDIKERAVHYDTKHHQDKKAYVESFIRDMAKYKINMLVWEWEDKLAYPSQPEIGAPGAFTMAEMQEFTAYAKKYHIELVPLVQGLGHVSFILKWPQHAHLREIANSNWEFCPLKEGSYDLLFRLWDDAIEATPGSEYIHIGSDETYELAHCQQCKAKASEIGASGVYHLFVNKATKYLKSKGRKVMAWERPMGWKMSQSPAVGIEPDRDLVLTESYEYEKPGFKYAKEAKALGHEVFAYDPNPGIEQMFLPYFFRESKQGRKEGSLEGSYKFLTSTAISGVFDGMINTSWDDSGLHNQVWMLSFVTSAAFSWNGKKPGLEEFTHSFFNNYYGEDATDMQELFELLNEGAFYYMNTFERKVWAWGDVGKTHLPDLPRGDALEYDPYWIREYREMLLKSSKINEKMKRAIQITENNLNLPVKNKYDFEIFRSIARMITHTTQTYKDLESLENLITKAHRSHFIDHKIAYNYMEEASLLITKSIERRAQVYGDLVKTWEKSRLPKGYSTANQKYFFQQDRARHFAQRTADMSYMIYDEQLLDLEGYQNKLKEYMKYYADTYLK